MSKAGVVGMVMLALFAGTGVWAKPAPTKHPASRAHAAPAAARPGNGGALTAKAPAGALNGAYTAYINRLRGKLDHNWYLVDGKNKVTLSADVAPDGSVTNLSITSSPSNTLAEQAASDAFNHSQPLESLPATSGPVKLTLVFESFADPHGDNNRSICGQIEAAATQPTGAATNSGDASRSGSDSSSH